MSFILLGILNSQVSGGAAASSYDLLSTTLISSNTTSVTFSSLNNYSDYQHLQLRIVGRSSRADYQDQIGIRYNGISSSTYALHNLHYNATSVSSTYETGFSLMFSSANFDLFSANETANFFGPTIIDILDFNNANKTKTLRKLSGLAGGTQTKSVMLSSGFQTTAGALTSIELFPRYGSWVSGSRLSLYGIKGA